MKKKTASHTSRKAPQGREGQASTQAPNLSSATDPPSAHNKPYDLIKLGVDNHAAQYTFARMVDHLGVQPPQSLPPEAFIEFLKKQLTLARRVVLVYEAGPYGFALYRQATELGAQCLVCAPERLSRGRKRVNDKIDARELLNRLDRHLAGNSSALRLVHPPTIQQEMARRRARQRNTYRKERQRWMGRGRSLLHTLGIARPGRWWQASCYQVLLKRLRERYGQEVVDQVDAELADYLEMLNRVQSKLTAQLRKAALEKIAAPQNPSCRLKGIGPLSAELLDREIGDWNRFKNRRQIASYTGLCPGEDSSGDSRMSLSIDKHGNPRLRALLVECAWLLTRFQKDYKPLQKYKGLFEKDSRAGKALRKKAVVALARHLAIDLWRIRTGRARPQDLGLVLVP
jgi:transposase